MDPRYFKPFATQSSRAPPAGPMAMVPAAADASKPKPKASKKAPPPDSDLATKRAHLIETKPGKKEVSSYFQSIVDEIGLREEA